MRSQSGVYRSLAVSIQESFEHPDPTGFLLSALRDGFDAHGTSFWHFDKSGHIPLDSVRSTMPHSAAARRSFEVHYDKLNPILPKAAAVMRLGDVATNLDFVALREYRNSEFYNDYVRTNLGYLYEMGTVVENRDGLDSLLFIARAPTQRDFSAAERMTLKSLAPLVQQVVALRRHAERLGYALTRIADALDLGGIVGFNTNGLVCYERGRLLDLLVSSGWISIDHGKLRFPSETLTKRIQVALADALKGEPSITYIAKMMIGAGEVALEVLRAPRALSDRDVKVWLLLRAPAGLELQLKLDGIVRRCALTPRERQVAARMLAGEDVETIASRLEIEVSTARAHIKALLRKAGTSRQSSFIARVHDFRR